MAVWWECCIFAENNYNVMEESNVRKMISDTVHKASPSARVILYGSRARGDAHPNSDWDVIIIVDEPKVDFQSFMSLGNPLYDIADENDIEINPIIYTKSQWQNSKPTLFKHNVMKEGIEL